MIEIPILNSYNGILKGFAMKFKSLQDILKFAVAKEEASVAFYRSLAARVKKPETTAVFELLARQEEKHIEAIRLELIKLGFTVSESLPKDNDVDENADSLEIDDRAAEMNYVDALRLGIQKERAAFKLYAELMAMAEHADARKMFLELAEEEMRHVLRLEREIEVITYPNK